MPPLRVAATGVVVAAMMAIGSESSAQVRAEVFAQGLNLPLAVVQDPGDSTVQFVVEQGGRIRVLREGILLATPFIDLSASIATGGERGLLGLAFPPDPSSSRFFVNFTNTAGDTVVARLRRSAANRLVADPSSRFDLQWSTGERVIRQPFANHNGGNLVFGPDGCLYVGLGDGGSGDDPGNRAQDGTTLLGKMLRIDVSVPDEDPRGFRVPADNPFVGGGPVPARPETWAFGLRNPWRYSFDDPARGGTGALIIGDVGQNAYEEVDYEPRGRGRRNYGWRVREGRHPNIASPPAYGPLTDPILDYDRATGFTVIGGFVYRGRALGPALTGRYFYADLGGRVWSVGLGIDATGEAHVSDSIEHTAELGGRAALGAITSFGVDADGELYIVTQTGGRVLRLVSPETDGDGLPDSWEVDFGLDPRSATGVDGPDGDPDGDGRTNLEEYRAGTHPRGTFRRPFRGGRRPVDATVTLANPGQVEANVLLRYVRAGGGVTTRYLRLAPGASAAVALVEASPSNGGASFLAGLESNVVVLVEGAPGSRSGPVPRPGP